MKVYAKVILKKGTLPHQVDLTGPGTDAPGRTVNWDVQKRDELFVCIDTLAPVDFTKSTNIESAQLITETQYKEFEARNRQKAAAVQLLGAK